MSNDFIRAEHASNYFSALALTCLLVSTYVSTLYFTVIFPMSRVSSYVSQTNFLQFSTRQTVFILQSKKIDVKRKSK